MSYEQWLARIGELYGIEAQIRGQSSDSRQQIRGARAGPKLTDLANGSSPR
jgi:hypothetical protein